MCGPSTATSDALNTLLRYIRYLTIPFWGCLSGVMVKGVEIAVLGGLATFVGSTLTDIKIIIIVLAILSTKRLNTE